MRRAIRTCKPFVVAAMLFAVCLGVASAKGGPSYLEGATITGGQLAGPVHTDISIADQNWEMRPLHAPANGLFAGYFELFLLHQTPMPYGVTLHFDYERWGGETDRSGLYDGDRLLFFPTGSSGGDWYEASPQLARPLRNEIFWGLMPADTRGLRGSSLDEHTTQILLLLGAALLLAIGARVWRGNNEPASAVEVEARMRNRELPNPLVHF